MGEECGRTFGPSQAACLAVGAIGTGVAPAAADTLEWALVQAYQNNPSLNAQRASLRATDENVPQALSGYRPKLSITANGGYNYASTLSHTVNQSSFPNTVTYQQFRGHRSSQRGVGATATQTLFNGFQTANRTRQAESQVMGARETLRVTEQQVLLDAATAYMNLLRDQAILDLNRRNVEVLTEQLKQTRDRFNVGEVTRTDVAQAESRLAAGRSSLAWRAIELRHLAGQLPPRHRRRSGPARSRYAGRPAVACFARWRRRSGRAAEPVGAGRDVWRRCRRACGQGQRGGALSEPHALGHGVEELRPDIQHKQADRRCQ